MGSKMSKKPQKQKRPRVSGFVHDYVLEPVRKRPKTSKSMREAKFIASLAQQGRSATMFDGDKEKEALIDTSKPLPRWQSKWEIDMRPDPQKENMTSLRAWKSMPIPTTEVTSAKSKTTPNTRRSPSLTRHTKGRRNRYREKRSSLTSAKSRNTLTEVEEIEKMSIASYKVDEFKMIYKTEDIKTQNMLNRTSKLWHIEPKKNNKTWFLGLDQAHKYNQEQVSFENIPKHAKPYTSYVSLIRPMTRRENMIMGKPMIEKPSSNKPLAILEEE